MIYPQTLRQDKDLPCVTGYYYPVTLLALLKIQFNYLQRVTCVLLNSPGFTFSLT